MIETSPHPSVTLGSLARSAAGGSPPGAALTFRPYWWEAAPPSDEPGALPSETDVVIVGSGFTGLSAALTLVRMGRGVLVLDEAALGAGASTRNGGQIGSGNQKFRVRRLIELRGADKAAAMLREGVRMLDFIDDLVAREGLICHFRRCGRFRGAARPSHYEAMARDMEDLRRVAGVESFMVNRQEQHREIETDVFYGGSVLPQDAALHPGLYHAELTRRLRESGVAMTGFARVTRIARAGAGFEVTTARGKVRCADVIIATNGYTDALVPFLRRRIVPVESAIIATARMEPARLARLMPGNRVYGNSKRVFSYFRVAPDEPRILWGGRVGRGAPATSARGFAHLARDLLNVFPSLGDVAVTHGWTGAIGYTFDEVPHLGRTEDGIHYAVGYCGTGVSRATYFGHKIALQVLKNPEGRTSFDDLLFPAFPVPAIARMAVPFFEASYRLRDHFER